MADSNSVHVQRVFLRNKSIPAAHDKEYTVAEIYVTAERTVSFETVKGRTTTGRRAT